MLLELGVIYVLTRSGMQLELSSVLGHCIDGCNLGWKILEAYHR